MKHVNLSCIPMPAETDLGRTVAVPDSGAVLVNRPQVCRLVSYHRKLFVGLREDRSGMLSDMPVSPRLFPMLGVQPVGSFKG